MPSNGPAPDGPKPLASPAPPLVTRLTRNLITHTIVNYVRRGLPDRPTCGNCGDSMAELGPCAGQLCKQCLACLRANLELETK